jgi:hypothetical protein
MAGINTVRHTEMLSVIRGWFDAVGQANGPLLPDGWFGGRPYDNIYSLEEAKSTHDSLKVQLSEDTTLYFFGPCLVFVDGSDLAFEGFDQARLRWRPYGDPNSLYQELEYHQGQVRLVAPVGTELPS